jgi:hypothetical protein
LFADFAAGLLAGVSTQFIQCGEYRSAVEVSTCTTPPLLTVCVLISVYVSAHVQQHLTIYLILLLELCLVTKSKDWGFLLPAGGGSGVASGSGGGGRASAPYDNDYGISSYSQISGIAGGWVFWREGAGVFHTCVRGRS